MASAAGAIVVSLGELAIETIAKYEQAKADAQAALTQTDNERIAELDKELGLSEADDNAAESQLDADLGIPRTNPQI